MAEDAYGLLDDDESDAPAPEPTSRPRSPQAAPLPRIWKTPEPEPAEATGPTTAKVKAKSGRKRGLDDSERKPGEIEATPQFDTVETRQRVRVFVGVAALGVMLLVGYAIWSSLAPSRPSDEDEEIVSVDPTATKAAQSQAAAEREAREALSLARENAKAGKPEQALIQLKAIVANYSATRAGGEAQEALKRPAQGLPLFLDGAAGAAKAEVTSPPTPAQPPPGPTVEVAVVGPAAPTPGPAEAVAVKPANPAEPRRETGLMPNSSPTPAPANVRVLPPGFKPRPDAGYDVSGWPREIIADRDGATMVFIPGGSFTMGRNDGTSDVKPAHQVTLAPYYLDQHEVTVRQYNLFAREASRAPASRPSGNAQQTDNHPVVLVSFEDAQAYGAWTGKHIPTEAQWEYAARTPDGRVHPWGPGEPAWERPRAWKQVDPVMVFPTDLSPFGIFDLAGNTWEWVADWYDSKYYLTFRSAPAVNPTGPARPATRTPQRTVKGGSKLWDCAWREGMAVTSRYPFLGFRCALSLDGGSPAQAVPNNGAQPPAGGNSNVPVPF